jgi:hypothetical protein
VKDKKIDNISANGKEVTITLVTGDEIAKGETITLTQKLPVYDKAGNEFTLDKSVDVTRPKS